jgi:hypothetical protein
MHKVFTSFEKQAKQERNCIALVNLSSFESQTACSFGWWLMAGADFF